MLEERDILVDDVRVRATGRIVELPHVESVTQDPGVPPLPSCTLRPAGNHGRHWNAFRCSRALRQPAHLLQLAKRAKRAQRGPAALAH